MTSETRPNANSEHPVAPGGPRAPKPGGAGRNYLSRTAAVFGLLLAGFCLAAAVTVKSGWFQGYLRGQINARIPGELSWKALDLSPLRGQIMVRGLTLKTSSGKVVAEVEALGAGLDWTGFGDGALRLSSLTADRPRLSVEINGQGETDLVAALVSRDNGSPDPGSTGQGSSPLNLIIREGRIRGGRLEFTGPGQTVSIGDLDLRLTGLDLAGEMLTLAVDLKDSRINTGDLDIDLPALSLSGRLDGDQLSDLDLALRAPGIDLTVRGAVSSIFDTPDLDINAALAADAAAEERFLAQIMDLPQETESRGKARIELTVKGSPDNPTATVEANFGPGSLLGQPLTAARISARLENRVITLAPSLVDPGTGPVELRGTVTLEQTFPNGFAGKPAGPETIAYTLSARQEALDLAQLLSRFNLLPAEETEGKLTPAVTLTGRGILPGRITAEIDAEVGAAGVRLPGLQVPADFKTRIRAGGEGEGLAVHELTVQGPGISGTGSGHLDVPGLDPEAGTITGTITFTAPDLTVPAALLGLEVSGRADLSLKAAGPLSAPVLLADLEAGGLAAEGLHWDRAEVSARIDAGGGQLSNAVLRQGNGRLKAAGRIGPDAALDLDLTLEDLNLEGIAPDLGIRGILSGTAVIGGTPVHPRVDARLTGDTMAAGGIAIGRVDTALTLSDDMLSITRADLTAGRSRASVTGQVNLKKRTLDIRASAPELNLADLAGPAGLRDQISGSATLKLTAAGPLDAPELTGSLRARDLTTKDFPEISAALSATFRAQGPPDRPEDIRAEVDLTEASLTRDRQTLARIDNAVFTLADRKLSLTPVDLRIMDRAAVALSGQMGLDGTLTASARGDIPLAAAASFAEGVRSADGEIRLSLTAIGPVQAPDIQGTLAFSDLELGLEDLEQSFRQVRGKLTFTPEAVRIERFSGRLGEGTFEVTGSAGLAGGKPDRFALGLEARQIPLDIPDTLSLTLNSRLSLTGTPEKSDLTGRIDLLEGRYFRDVDLNLIDLATRKTRKVAPEPKTTGPAFLKTVTVNVHVGRREPLLVDNNLAYLTISPDLTLRGTAHAPVLAGRAQVDEGTIFFQKAKFDVTGGTIDFVNPYKIEPEIDVTGETVIRSWTITVKVSGTPEDLELSFSSDPSEPDADILSLIAFGKTTREMGTAQGSGQLATASAAAGLVAGPLGEKLKAATGLDEVDISMEESDGTTGVRVSLGADLSRQLSVAYGVDIRDGETVQQVTTYYKLLEHLLMSGFQDTSGRFGGGLKYRLEFR